MSIRWSLQARLRSLPPDGAGVLVDRQSRINGRKLGRGRLASPSCMQYKCPEC